MSNSLQPHGLQHARLPCPSPTSNMSFLKLMSIESVMLSSHLILCHPLLLLPSIFPSIRVFSSESALCVRWPKYWSCSIHPSSEYSGLISFRLIGLISLLSKGLSRVLTSTTIQKHQFFGTQPSLWSNSHIQYTTTGETTALTLWTFVSKVMSLLYNMLSRFVIVFLPRSKHLLFSWLQTPYLTIRVHILINSYELDSHHLM